MFSEQGEQCTITEKWRAQARVYERASGPSGVTSRVKVLKEANYATFGRVGLKHVKGKRQRNFCKTMSGPHSELLGTFLHLLLSYT
jgi:hypothetical protein